ncbi:universal stress protein [Mucilaginibacter sp. McL0603]|uniref:universal stress protein n=1 Tax=Mucilaginibacter sp. McL0603 TaxID=3415670 RepID=UPI003CF18094
MKTILVLTDFSINAHYVAHYALELAQKIRANLLVCNIYEVPAGEETTDRNSWPLRPSEENSVYDLGELVAQLKTTLDEQKAGKTFRPGIEQCSQEGLVDIKLNDIMSKYDILLAIISEHNRDNFNGFFGRDHAWDIIDNAVFPVLVIPYQVRFKPFKQIAFATLMKDTDIKALEFLSGLAKYSNAEILITTVGVKEDAELKNEKFIDQAIFMINYPKITYRNIIDGNVAVALKTMCKNVNIDLMAIVHRRRSYLQEVFGESVTRRMMDHPDKPLLIFPCSYVKETFMVC